MSNAKQAVLKIENGNKKAITGAALFAGGIGLEYFIVYPWQNRVQNKMKNAKSYNDSMDALTQSLSLLFVSAPAGAMKIIGPTLACVGATKAYIGYRDGINSDATKIHVWRPYIAGWVLESGSSLLGVVGSLSKTNDFANVALALEIGGDIMWGWATIWSLVYTGNKKTEVNNQKVSVGIYGNGLALNYRF